MVPPPEPVTCGPALLEVSPVVPERVTGGPAPLNVQGYVHRVGRTGRGGSQGLALTLVTPQDTDFHSELSQALRAEHPAVAENDAGSELMTKSESDDDSESESDDEQALEHTHKKSKRDLQQQQQV